MAFTLIHHWKLDEGTGTVANDSVGTNDGWLVGPVAWETTAPYGAIFNGEIGTVNGDCSIDWGDVCFVTTQQVKANYYNTVWVVRFKCAAGEISGGPIVQLIDKQSSTDDYPSSLSAYTAPISIYVGVDGYLYMHLAEDNLEGFFSDYWRSTSKVDDENWHQVVFRYCQVFDPNQRFLYSLWVDGVEEISAVEAPICNNVDAASYFHIGGGANIYWTGRCGAQGGYINSSNQPVSFNGTVRDVRWYSGCATDSEIDALLEPNQPGEFSVLGGAVQFSLTRYLSAGTGEYSLNGVPVRLVADVETPEPVLPAAVMFSCNT